MGNKKGELLKVGRKRQIIWMAGARGKVIREKKEIYEKEEELGSGKYEMSLCRRDYLTRRDIVQEIYGVICNLKRFANLHNYWKTRREMRIMMGLKLWWELSKQYQV